MASFMKQALALPLPRFEDIQRSVFHYLNSATASLSQALEAHAHILKTGIFDDTYVAIKLLSQYANHLCVSEANRVLSSIPDPNVFCFSTLIYAYSKQNLFDQSLRVFSQMLSHGLLPDRHLLPNVFNACARMLALKAGKQVHGILFVSGVDLDSFVQISLIHMYIKCHQIRDAHKVFDRLSQPNVFTFSALIFSYARQGCIDEAKKLFSEMFRLGVEPNLVSWTGLIAGFNHSGNYEEAVCMFQKLYLEG